MIIKSDSFILIHADNYRMTFGDCAAARALVQFYSNIVDIQKSLDGHSCKNALHYKVYKLSEEYNVVPKPDFISFTV